MPHEFPTHGDLRGWSNFLATGPIPILGSTKEAVLRLRPLVDTVLTSELSVVALRDPLFALSIIRHLQQHRNKLRTVDITTIEHALMMLGVEPFFHLFGAEPTLEDVLGNEEGAKNAILAVARRSYVASRIAQDWAAKCMDVESEELQVAALIHDAAEILLWMRAPGMASQIRRDMREQPKLRSAAAQRHVLGVSLVDVEIEMCKQWGLPEILLSMLLDHESTPRMATVSLAVRLARHCATSWENPALPDDWAEIATHMAYRDAGQAKDDIVPYVDALMARWDRHNAPPANGSKKSGP